MFDFQKKFLGNQWPVYVMACCWNYFSINFVFFNSNFKIGILNFFRQNLIPVFRSIEIFESPCFNTWRFKNLRGLNMEIFESSQSIHGDSKISMYCNMEAKLFIFSNLHVSIHRDSKIFLYKTQKFLNIRVSIHGDSKISVHWNAEIQKLLCFIHAYFFLIAVYFQKVTLPTFGWKCLPFASYTLAMPTPLLLNNSSLENIGKSLDDL